MVQGPVAIALPWYADPVGAVVQLQTGVIPPVRALVALLVAVASAVVIRRLLGRPLSTGLRDRFVLGLPWGTLLTVGGVALVYAVVQGGWEYPNDPLVLPFRSWGYDYLLGTLTSGFAHNGWGHVTGNLTATIAFAGVAEYAVGHYPRNRGAATFTSPRTNPYARILLVPLFAILVGLLTSVTALGPLIGFSGVVFAFAGFAIVQLPIAATLALVGVRIVRLLFSTITSPERPGRIYESVITPWWAEVAIQTHAVGLIVGLLAGIGYAWYRREWKNPFHVWFAVLVFSIAQGLWAIFVPQTASSWLLLRWVGTAAVFLLATLTAIAVYRRDRVVLSGIDLHRREVVVGLLLAAVLAMSLVAIPFHVAPVGDEPAPNAVLEVGDYSIGYGEGVPEGYINAVDVPLVDIPTVPASGVIVTNDERNLWRQTIEKRRLETNGRGRFLVGGLGWREPVYADWVGWRVAGNRSVYKVFLATETGEWRQSFASGPSRSGVVVAGYNLTLAPNSDTFTVTAEGPNRSIGPIAIPENGTRARLGPITLERVERRLLAIHNGTRVPIAMRAEQTR